MKASPRPLTSAAIGLAFLAAGLAGLVLFGPDKPIRPEPPIASAAPVASASAAPVASASASPSPDSSAEGAGRKLPSEEEDEPDPVVEWHDSSSPRPPSPEGKWDAPPRAATLALSERYKAQAARLASHGAREVSGKDKFDIVWPPEARPMLRQTKDSAIAVVEARMAEAAAIAGDEPLPEGLHRFFALAFNKDLPRNDQNWSNQEPSTPVGETKTWLGGRVFGVILRIEMAGGSDDVLVLFEREGKRYRKALVVAKHDYASIAEGQLGLDYEVRAVGTGYHVLTVHSRPWISSAWRGAHFQIFEPGASATQPRRLLDESNSARIGENAASISSDASGFSAEFISWGLITTSDDVTRDQVHHFVYQDGGYRRGAPFVRTVRDLPDEWVKLPWSKAMEFTAPASRAKLQPVHDRLAKAAEHLGLRGRMLKKTEGDRVRLRHIPDKDHAPIVFLVEGTGDASMIAEVIEE